MKNQPDIAANQKQKYSEWIIMQIIIQSKFFFLFIGREPTTWPANNCLQIMVCSCAMPSNCVWLQIICSCIKETVLFSFLWSLLRENGRSLRFPKILIEKQTWWSTDKTIIELGYRKISWFVIVLQINYLLKPKLATVKSQYFAQPRPIIKNIVNYWWLKHLSPRQRYRSKCWTVPSTQVQA